MEDAKHVSFENKFLQHCSWNDFKGKDNDSEGRHIGSIHCS